MLAIPRRELPGDARDGSLPFMTDLHECYVTLWNEPDPHARRQAIEALWRPDGRQLLQAPIEIREQARRLGFPAATLEVRGHEQLEFRVSRAYDEFVGSGQVRFRRRGTPTRVGDALKLEWEAVARDGTVTGGGTELILLAADGRIVADYQFIDS